MVWRTKIWKVVVERLPAPIRFAALIEVTAIESNVQTPKIAVEDGLKSSTELGEAFDVIDANTLSIGGHSGESAGGGPEM